LECELHASKIVGSSSSSGMGDAPCPVGGAHVWMVGSAKLGMGKEGAAISSPLDPFLTVVQAGRSFILRFDQDFANLTMSFILLLCSTLV